MAFDRAHITDQDGNLRGIHVILDTSSGNTMVVYIECQYLVMDDRYHWHSSGTFKLLNHHQQQTVLRKIMEYNNKLR